jgi:glycosyltransferase involved in cell wall biosynthesis
MLLYRTSPYISVVRLSGNSQLCSRSKPAPQVSVIVPAYNVSDYIAEALDSVFSQTFKDYEVIVVNDGSPDTERLEQVLQPYRDRILYIVQKNKGLSGARNTAIRAATGKYVALLDADDIWESDYLAVQFGFLQQHPEVDVVACNALMFGDKTYGGREFMAAFPSRGPVNFESLVKRKCNLFVSVTARRSVIEQAGLFDEGLRSCEDYDLWLRLAAAGRRMGYHHKILVRYRRREGSLSADPVWMAESNLKVLDKIQRTFAPGSREWNLLDRQRRRKIAEANYWNARKAVARGDTAAALDYFRRAGEFFRSPRLMILIFVLRVMPSLVLRAHKMKQRLKASA